MNYLAHAYLSFKQPDVLLGNMISDYVKGKRQFDYPLTVQIGIRLHRAIDNFTDGHQATRELKSFFRERYRLYSGAFADVVYDHFLANDPAVFNSQSELMNFASETYRSLEDRSALFPQVFQEMFPYMKQYDWLSNYRYTWAIEQSFKGLVLRSVYLTESEYAFEIFNTNYKEMQLCYNDFFPSVKKYTIDKLTELTHS